MFPQELRFFISGGGVFDGVPEITVDFFDWDQRRMLTIKGTVVQFPLFEDKEPPVIAQHIYNLSPKVCAFTVDKDGLLIGVSTDEEDDPTPFIPYLRFSDVKPLAGCRTITYSKLTELDRMGPGINKCYYEDESGALRTVAFKYRCVRQPMRRRMAWNKLQVIKSLPPHPNLFHSTASFWKTLNRE